MKLEISRFSLVVVLVESLLQNCAAVSHRCDDAMASWLGAERVTGQLALISATSSGHSVPERVEVRLT